MSNTPRNKGKALKPVLINVKMFTPGAGNSKGAVIVQLAGRTEAMPRKFTYLHDPANISSMVLATEADDALLDRCINSKLVLAWSQSWWLVENCVDALFPPDLPS